MFKKVVCAICVIVGGQGSGLFAMGIFFQPDAKASAMGSAFVSVADNASAVYWNPAGLTQLTGTGVMVTGMASVNDAKGDSLANTESANVSNGDFPLPKIYPTESDKYSSEKLETSAYLPGVFAYTNIGGLSVGIVSQVLGGGGGKWSDSISFPSGEDTITYDDDGNEIIVPAVKDTLTAKVNDEYGFLVSGITVGKEVVSGFACAIGLNYIYKTNETTIEKTYVLGPNSALLGSGIGDYRLYYKDEGSGSGIEPLIAVLYSPLDFPAIRMGATYRFGATIKTDGTVRNVMTGVPGYDDSDYKTKYTQKYSYPSTLGLGVAYNPLYDFTTGSLKNLLIAVGISFSNYSVVKKDTDYKDDSVYADGVEKMGWEDSTQINIGVEYPTSESLSFRCGLTNDANIIKSTDRTLLNTNQYSLLYLTTGVGYTIKKYTIDFYYGHGFSSVAEQGAREYRYPSNDFRLSVSAKVN